MEAPIVVYPPGSMWGRPICPILHFDPAPLCGVPLSKLKLRPANPTYTKPFSFMHMDGEPAEPPFIYFVSAGGYLKVGMSSCDVRKRLKALQTSCPTELVVEHIMPGGRDDERHYHELFAPLRSSGEWFLLTKELRDVIDLFRANGLDLGPDAIIPGQERKFKRQGAKAYEAWARKFDLSAFDHLLTTPTAQVQA